MNAVDQIRLYDRRRHNAVALTAALMAELDDVLDPDQRPAVHDRLFSVLYTNGASVITDEERAKLGLEPRDELGWTPSEKVAQKRRELEIMQTLLAMSAIPLPAGPYNDPMVRRRRGEE